MGPNTVVIYHADCTDGFCAAWIIRRAFPGEDMGFVAAHYGDTPPDVTGKNVIIVDFSYPREVLLKMKGQATRLLVYDHHKTAQKDLEGLDFCVFDMNKSGAGLAHYHVVGVSHPSSWIIDAVEDNDLWKFQRPYTKEIVAALRSIPQTFEEWSRFETRGREVAIEQGKVILAFQKEQVYRALRTKIHRFIGVVEVPTVNSCLFQSEIGHELLKIHPNAPFSAVWYDNGENAYVFSLRSEDSRMDVSLVAKCFGGGGHRNSAGFTAFYDPIEGANLIAALAYTNSTFGK